MILQYIISFYPGLMLLPDMMFMMIMKWCVPVGEHVLLYLTACRNISHGHMSLN